jgi:hypothetical protein
VNPSWKKLGNWDTPLKGIVGPLLLYFSFFLLPGYHEVSMVVHQVLPIMMLCLTAGLKAMEPIDHGLKLLKQAETPLFSF